MKEEILLALSEKWEAEVAKDEIRDGSPKAELNNANLDGENTGLLRCAKDLKAIIKILGS